MEQTSQTKQAILETSIALFAAKGYDGTGVQEICTESHITKPTLYHHFSSKVGLLTAIIEIKGKDLLQRLSDAAEYRHDFTASLTRLLQTEIAFAKDYPDFFRLHCALGTASTESEAGKVHRPFEKQIHSIFETFFVQSVAEIGNMRGKEALFSALFHQISRSVALEALDPSAKLPHSEDAIIHAVVHAFVYGVASG